MCLREGEECVCECVCLARVMCGKVGKCQCVHKRGRE